MGKSGKWTVQGSGEVPEHECFGYYKHGEIKQ